MNNLNDKELESYGPAIAIVIIAALLFFGGWFYLMGRGQSPLNPYPAEEGWEVGEAEATTTEEAVIPQDFNLDAELEGLNAALNQ